jgi:exosome complex RNA-binding protein Csl4
VSANSFPFSRQALCVKCDALFIYANKGPYFQRYRCNKCEKRKVTV